jgi:hypothetical protein
MIFYTHERNFGCRIREYVYRGLKTVALENEFLRAGILADKGTDLFELLYKPKDVDFLWHSPWGVRNPAAFIPTTHTPASSFLDFYEGGWQDCFPTGGNPCEYRGLPFGAHGETPTIPWDYTVMEDSPERISVRFRVRTYRTPFAIEKDVWMERGKPVLFFSERITNEGRVPMEVMWGQHPAFGAPFVEAGCRIDLPGGRVHCEDLSPNTRYREGVYDWPLAVSREGGTIDLRIVSGIEADTTDTLRISDLSAGWYALRNEALGVGFGMRWNLEVFPALWFWQVYGGAYGPPWYGRTYTVALEPFSTARPTVVDAIQDGTARVLRPEERVEAEYAAVAMEGSGEITLISADGRVSRR